MDEKISDENLGQLIFAISFCDIPFQDTKLHRECYGNYAIVLHKDWGIENGVSPVRYIHKNSPGVSKNYLKIREKTISLKNSYHSEGEIDYNILYLLALHSLYEPENGKLNYEKNIDKKEVEKIRSDFEEFYKFLKNNYPNKCRLFTKYMLLFMYRINELHNELSLRDIFMRQYSEDFKCPKNNKLIKNKIIYDEREWRAVKIFTLNTDSSESTFKDIFDNLNKGYLPKNYNLKFTNKDIYAILIDSNKDKGIILDYLDDKSVIKPELIEDKIELIDKYQEK